MSKTIAGLYEINNKIGAGGGGVVFLGWHKRLNKTVVLKADKRKLSAGERKLRREVDMLKGLNHYYIPQVYDFIEEDGIVYTVMDYIEGTSLDKVIASRKLPKQSDVIKWACQLLDALSYLHQQPPYGILHGDIKPANIMLRESGDICLIDFNIALALGENGAVRIGYSKGYASPEHYASSSDYFFSAHSAVGSETPNSVKNAAESKTEYTNDRIGESVTNTEYTGGKREVSDSGTEYTIANTGYTYTRTEYTGTDTEYTSAETEGLGTKTEYTSEKTEYTVRSVSLTETEKGNSQNREASLGSTSKSQFQGVLLDARSDIYSLGATLYHIISGIKPPQNAWDVVPLGPDICSIAFSNILKKAMDPYPAKRFQSAAKMLEAILKLPTQDPRAVKLKRIQKSMIAATVGLFLTGGALTYAGLMISGDRQKSIILSDYSNTALEEGDIDTALKYALEAIPEKGFLKAPVTPQAIKALTEALGVYDLSDGFRYDSVIPIPSAPFGLTLSPKRDRLAVVYSREAVVYDLQDMEVILKLPMNESAFARVAFAGDDRVVYAADAGISCVDISTGDVLWTGKEALSVAASKDGSRVAATDRRSDITYVYDAVTGKLLRECSFDGRKMFLPSNDIFADSNDYIFCLNDDGTYLAASYEDGSLILYDLSGNEDDLILYEESDMAFFSGAFDKNYFAVGAGTSAKGELILIDTEKKVQAGGYTSQNPISVRLGERGIIVSEGGLAVLIDTNSLEEKELAYLPNTSIYTFGNSWGYTAVVDENNELKVFDMGGNTVFSDSQNSRTDFIEATDSCIILANRDDPEIRVLRSKGHSDKDIFRYDPAYQHDEARLSHNGETAMLFNYKEFYIADSGGGVAAYVEFPNPENIYDQQYRKDPQGSYLEVIWNDGTVRFYSADDGRLISEEKRSAPDKSLLEEFQTEKYRFVSTLHEAPEVYEKKGNKLIGTLEKDSYLTYVTETEDYIVTEYVSTDGERYGLLLNQKLEVLAKLPGLCDIYNNMLIFDYGAGALRASPIFSLEELKNLAQERMD